MLREWVLTQRIVQKSETLRESQNRKPIDTPQNKKQFLDLSYNCWMIAIIIALNLESKLEKKRIFLSIQKFTHVNFHQISIEFFPSIQLLLIYNNSGNI